MLSLSIQQIQIRDYFMLGSVVVFGDTVATKTDTVSALWAT